MSTSDDDAPGRQSLLTAQAFVTGAMSTAGATIASLPASGSRGITYRVPGMGLIMVTVESIHINQEER